MTLASHPSTSIWPLRRVREDPLVFLRTLAESGEDIVPCRIGRQLAFLLNHPAHVEDVLVRHPDKFVKGRGFDRAKRLLGEGLLTAAGALHSARRRIVQPAFHRQRLADYARVVVAHATRVADGWTAGTRIDIGREMRRMTLGVVGEALFGVDLSQRAAEIQSAVDMAGSSMDGLISLIAPGRATRNARHQLDTIVEDLIARRRGSEETPDDLLGLLLAAGPDGEAPSPQQLRDDVVTILLAGHDTISHALTWTWMLLAEHDEAAERLGAELNEVLGNQPPSMEQITQLAFTRGVLAEALRLFPPAWVIVRRAAAPHQCGRMNIPQGALVLASPYVTHRDARFFSDPLAFRPERWLAPGGHKLSFFPFGAGLRSCVGEGFAWMEGTLALATLAQRWRLRRLSDVPTGVSPGITLRPLHPVLMDPRRRASA